MISRLKSIGLLRPQATTVLAWLLPLIAWAPLTYPGYFEFHSGFLPIFNLNDLARHLTDFSWAPTVGQAYDLWRGERVLPYLLAMLPRALGAAPVAAIKGVFGVAILAGALGVYFWARRRLGAWPALVAALVYAFWPLGLATVYVRGAFAEAVLLGLMPWLLWAADGATEGRRGPAIGLALALAAALWTQAGLALWLAVLVLIYLLIPARSSFASVRPPGDKSPGLPEQRPMNGAEPLVNQPGPVHRAPLGSPEIHFRAVWRRSEHLLAWLGGLALGAAGLLPVILRHGLGGGAWPLFADHFVYPHQLLQAGWGFGPSIAGPYDTLTFQLGLVACGLAVLGIANRKTQNANDDTTQHAIRSTQYVAVAFVLLLAFLSTTLAAPVWKPLSFLSRTLTYPWQLLLLAGPWLAWLAGTGARGLLDLLPGVARSGDRPQPQVEGVARSGDRPQQQVEGVTQSGDGPQQSQNHAAALICAALLVLILLGSYDTLTPKTTNIPIPDLPVAIFGDNEIALLSAVTAGPPGPGGRVTALVRWQALRPLERDYTIFFHVIGPDGQPWGQQDTMPQGNKLPTTRWQPGQIVTDQYQATLKSDAPIAEGYRYALGLYLWQTGQRLTTGTDDKVMLTP